MLYASPEKTARRMAGMLLIMQEMGLKLEGFPQSEDEVLAFTGVTKEVAYASRDLLRQTLPQLDWFFNDEMLLRLFGPAPEAAD